MEEAEEEAYNDLFFMLLTLLLEFLHTLEDTTDLKIVFRSQACTSNHHTEPQPIAWKCYLTDRGC